MPEADVDTNIEALEEAIKNVKTGQVTYAVRDTHIDDKEIHEGDIMGIGDRGILAVGQSVEETTKDQPVFRTGRFGRRCGKFCAGSGRVVS